MSATLNHAHLGELKGNAVDKAVQFLGLKYASLKDRFSAPELVDSYGGGADATRYGPPPVSPAGAIKREFGFIQHQLELPEVPTHSDLEGLNLNITVPTNNDGAIDPNAKLPVYVFIHGGGFAVGSSWYPHYDPALIVKTSVEKGKPIIGITINYRLGATGFLTSKELRKAGYKANNGFHDQRAAMHWIKKFIGGFGGDPDEVTACGESAGGFSVIMFLCSKEPLMKRCLSTGGAVLLFKPVTEPATEASYQKVIEALGLADKSPEDRIEALLNLPIDDLWQKIPPGAQMIPSVDGDTVPGVPDFEIAAAQEDNPLFMMPGRKWCEALMIGDSKLDASIIAYMGIDDRNPGIAQNFIDSVNKTLSSHPEVASQLLTSYNISSDTDDDEALTSILRFATEISFYAPSREFAKGWPKTPDNKFFLYHFNEGIPWDGRFKGEAGHILDVAYLFQNYNEYLDDAQQKVSKEYAGDFINFVNGENPWPPVQDGKLSAKVYGPSADGVTSRWVADGDPAKVGRDDRVLKLGEMAGFDRILKVFQDFWQAE